MRHHIAKKIIALALGAVLMAGSVQISVNGDSNIMYQSSVDLSEPLRRNLDIVEDD